MTGTYMLTEEKAKEYLKEPMANGTSLCDFFIIFVGIH